MATSHHRFKTWSPCLHFEAFPRSLFFLLFYYYPWTVSSFNYFLILRQKPSQITFIPSLNRLNHPQLSSKQLDRRFQGLLVSYDLHQRAYTPEEVALIGSYADD